jgi:predicted FMN-binding regulatory protein PaiB
MVAELGAAELITTAPDGYPQATLLPILWTGDVVLAHMARANPHWTEIADGDPALLVCGGAQAYVSPSWYAVDSQLRGIVGLEIRIERVDAKAKLSQNRSKADRHGVIEGLAEEPSAGAAVAAAMQALEPADA